MTLTKKIAWNTLIQFGGKIIGTLIGVLTIALMTRYLGQSGFGQYSTIIAYLQFFAILVDLGLALTVVRLIADPANNQKQIVNNVFTVRFFSALIFLGLAPLIVIFFPYDPLVKIGISLTTLAFFFISLNQILIGLFQKELKMDKVAISEISGRLVLLILVALAAWFNWGLLAIMVATIISSLVNFALNYLFAHDYVKIQFSFDWPVWRKIISTTWPIAISTAFNLVYFKADTIILSLVRSQAEVGIYNAPYRVLEILTTFIYTFIGLIFPILTVFWAQKNWEEFKKLYQQTFDFLIILAMPLAIGTFFVAQDFMVLIAGPEFAASGLVLQIINLATAIIFINCLFGHMIVVIEKQKPMIWAYIFVAIVSLVGYIITIPIYGYIGAAVFTVISELLILFFNLVVTVKTTKYMPSLLIILKTLGACLIMATLLYLLKNQHVLLRILLASVVYLISLYLVKGFSREFIMEILSFKNNPKEPKIDGIL